VYGEYGVQDRPRGQEGWGGEVEKDEGNEERE
jgi:hypothetical protein